MTSEFESNEVELLLTRWDNAGREHPPSPTSAVLINDDNLIQMVWKALARAAGVEFRSFGSLGEFYKLVHDVRSLCSNVQNSLPLLKEADAKADQIETDALLGLMLDRARTLAKKIAEFK